MDKKEYYYKIRHKPSGEYVTSLRPWHKPDATCRFGKTLAHVCTTPQGKIFHRLTNALKHLQLIAHQIDHSRSHDPRFDRDWILRTTARDYELVEFVVSESRIIVV